MKNVGPRERARPVRQSTVDGVVIWAAVAATLIWNAPVVAAQPVVWTHLFNGRSMHGWNDQKGNPIPAESAWQVDDGAIHLDQSRGTGGNIFYQLPVADFEMVFEFKVEPGGNNGIKYRVKDFEGRTLGCEYQIIDDVRLADRLGSKQKTACLYDLYETIEHDRLRPAGEWNRGAIIVKGNTIEHWLNGRLVVSATVGSETWKERVGASKFSEARGFGENRVGRIMLTDHGDQVWFRNLFLRRL